MLVCRCRYRALEGVAGTLDAIFRDDRTPLQIYADVKTKLNITIDNWERMTPQEQADAIGITVTGASSPK